ncbi:putative phage tail protein [Clostridium butyricum]|uniref:putative phage tail protein n=1 Tax=Clostridium butyricum TaxID=1492 RepID=UPI00374F8B6B
MSVNLFKYVPEIIYENNAELQAIYDIQGKELDRIKNYADDIKKQFVIDTATWGLDLYEEAYGIPINHVKSYEQRRKIIKSKKLSSGIYFDERIKVLVNIFVDGKVTIIENTGPYQFTIELLNASKIEENLKDLINAINEIKEAHLNFILYFKFERTYNSQIKVGGTLVSTRKYLLTSDWNYSYNSNSNEIVAATAINTKKYTLSNNINANYSTESNNNIAADIVKTNKYEIS